MSLRWSFGSTTDEHGDIIMEDTPNWSPTSAVYKVGRELSGWLFRQPLSPPLSPKTYVEFQRFHRASPYQRPTGRTLDCSNPPTPFINTLPQDIFREIFYEYVYGCITNSNSRTELLAGSYQRITACRGAATTPILLGHVCSSWRAIAFSTPSLWSKLYAIRPEARDVPLFSFWLARTSSCPLDLTITQRFKEGDERFDLGMQQILYAAIRYSSRWRSVTLQLEQDMEQFFTSLPADLQFQSLKQCNINLLKWSAEGNQYISRLLCTSPCLRSLELGTACRTPISFLEIPWTALTSATFGYITLTDLFKVLPQMPSIKSLAIQILAVDSHSPSPGHTAQPIQKLAHLCTLTLGLCSDLSLLFDTISLPSLSHLALGDGFGFALSVESGWSALSRLVERSECHLRSLSWDERQVEERRLIQDLGTASSTIFREIQSLRIGCSIGNQTLESLTLGNEFNVFPSLLSLELRDCWADEGVLKAMVLSRPDLAKLWVKVKSRNYLGSVVAASSPIYKELSSHRPDFVIQY